MSDRQDMGIPIYLVVGRYNHSHPIGFQYGILDIIKVYACDFSDYKHIWDTEIAPLQNTDGGNVIVHMYSREAPNPFKSMAHQETIQFKTVLPMGEGASDNPFTMLQSVIEKTPDTPDTEIPYHEKIWEE